jgi:hypothetical protein
VGYLPENIILSREARNEVKGMYNSNAKTRKPTVCKGCGKQIKWVRGKGKDTKSVPVEPSGVYFLPSESGTPYVMADGKVQRGRPASDGILGYHKHDCPAFKPRVLSEREQAQRRWA